MHVSLSLTHADPGLLNPRPDQSRSQSPHAKVTSQERPSSDKGIPSYRDREHPCFHADIYHCDYYYFVFICRNSWALKRLVICLNSYVLLSNGARIQAQFPIELGTCLQECALCLCHTQGTHICPWVILSQSEGLG